MRPTHRTEVTDWLHIPRLTRVIGISRHPANLGITRPLPYSGTVRVSPAPASGWLGSNPAAQALWVKSPFQVSLWT
jgi:hypothetical protein